ncbi:hypothetical protein ZHAS_00006578 [Anopheles sinensis]|uniref:Uncharacterized protein n=1 Tax=Anopheles sinensis TaxID=74873 RepID=A0A084VMP0_ANOSI|nr:hypothetical protein ZHAS_00006578 [Anopheles sinensis]
MGPLLGSSSVSRWFTVGWLLLATVTLLCTVDASPDSSQGTVRKRVLLDRTPVLPDKVRLLAECGAGQNCTRTCPENYALDSRQQYCRPKRQGSCPPGYVQRAVGGGCVLEDIQCPPGSTREGSRCVIRSYSCPPGYASKGTSCVRDSICQPGYRWENGLCFPAGARIFCPPGYTEQRTGNCAPAACADCCDCQDETVATICPPGYSNHWGRCVRLLQASPDLRISSVMYRLPVECRATGETFNEGRCEAWSVVGRPACRSGHFYNGSCVEVARCHRGTLNNVCSCEFEQHLAATCPIGKLQEQVPGSCVVSKVHCRPPGRLRNGVCVRESKARSTCPEGVPFQREYCAIDVPRCPRGFTLDDHGLCKKMTPCRMDCGPYQKHGSWCGLTASCPEGYILNDHGYCVRETVHPAYSCPPGTNEHGPECISETPLCRSNYNYNPSVNLCVRCDEQPIQCPRGNLTGGRCEWSEQACPSGYQWSEGMCIKSGNDSRKYRCRKGYEFENLCVHGELACPGGHELLGESCVVKEDVHCPDGSYPLDGRCSVAKECPEHFQAGSDACIREVRRLINSTRPVCPGGFEYDGEVCISRTTVEASVTRRDAICPEGYERRSGDCVRTIQTFAVCPPRTIYTDRNDRCYCEVDLMCPHGYERSGTDCTFRSAGYTPFVNFLNPCYGAFCANLYCLSQCLSPPCPFEPCADHPGASPVSSLPRPPAYGPASCLTGGQQDCPPQEVIGLVCPPGYERVNSSCFAYYDKRCPDGYDTIGGSPGVGCSRDVILHPICPPGYTRDGESCFQASCPNGFKLQGTTCEKRELRSPKPCPPGSDLFRGACYRRSACRNGTIDGSYCVEREFTRPTCPEGFVQRSEDCAIEGSCSTDSIYIDGACVRFTEPATCPDGTYRLGRLCVYPDPPECEDTPFVATDCTSEVDARGRCWRSTIPVCAKGYQLLDDRCVSCQTEQPSCPPNMTIQRREVCVADRVVCREGYFLRAGQCVKLHVARPRCPSEEYGLCGGFCIVAHTHECKESEYAAPACTKGFQHQGKCVQLGRCDAEYTLLHGECHLRTFADPSCHGKGTRVGALCVGGTPQCPPNYALMGGQCYSCLIENAHCASGATCSESFCQLDAPRCTTSGSIFDGQVCRQLTSNKPSCPAGTNPDRYDTNFCHLKSEKAIYNCPDEYHYQNGVCLKKLYKTPACPEGYKLRHGVCYKRVCTRMSSGSSCSDGLAVHAANTCTQCLNGTTSSTPSNDDPAATQGTVDLCCSVFSPRICQASGLCHHERETICGSFCFTEEDNIYLTVAHSIQIGSRWYLAPRRIDDEDDEGSGESGYKVDIQWNYNPQSNRNVMECSRCIVQPDDCPKHCNTYDCQAAEEECNFTDASTFCAQYRDGKICENMRLG